MSEEGTERKGKMAGHEKGEEHYKKIDEWQKLGEEFQDEREPNES